MVHLTIHTTVGCTICTGEVDDSTLLHLAINSHLLLRVHDIEIAVTRFEAHGELTRIANLVATGVSLLGCYDNHTSHSARTIYRGGTTILKNLERLDVVGIKSGNGRGDKRSSVSR